MAKAKNTYSWDCKTVDVLPSFEEQTDVVYNIHWRYNATSDKVDSEGNAYTSTVYGTQIISTDDIKDFIPFADLTNAKVTEWCESAMGSEKVDELKSNLDEQIENKINPQSVTLSVSE
tara:strand:- start:239 stop:592 length:354 start_codon:yes stop_codon:yes gene_type:complete